MQGRGMCLAATLTLAMVGGGTGAALAEGTHDGPQPPEEVSGVLRGTSFISNGATENVVLGPWGEGNLVRSENRGTGVRVTVQEVSDPRLDGGWEYWRNTDTYAYPGVGSPAPQVVSYTWRGSNEEGAWEGSGEELITGSDDDSALTTLLIGEGAYEDLSALVELRYDDATHDWTVHGFIFEGDMPEPPEPPAE